MTFSLYKAMVKYNYFNKHVKNKKVRMITYGLSLTLLSNNKNTIIQQEQLLQFLLQLNQVLQLL